MGSFSCEKIEVFFGGVAALKGVDLGFSETVITAIIGPNGAGKTTLFNVMSGFLKPSHGSCYLGKKDITHFPPYKVARMGVARSFQNLHLIFQFTALENLMLAFPSQNGESLLNAIFRQGTKEEENKNLTEAKKILKFVGLEEKSNEIANNLSYGQQKLLSLACCLATKSKILLLDEPVAGVSLPMIKQILSILRQLKQDNFTIIFIEHDLSVVRQIADKVIVMSSGKVISEGTSGEVLNNPSVMEAYFG